MAAGSVWQPMAQHGLYRHIPPLALPRRMTLEATWAILRRILFEGAEGPAVFDGAEDASDFCMQMQSHSGWMHNHVGSSDAGLQQPG